jgi:hypothetical protein
MEAVQTAGTYINPLSALFQQETEFTVETTQTFAKPTRAVRVGGGGSGYEAHEVLVTNLEANSCMMVSLTLAQCMPT